MGGGQDPSWAIGTSADLHVGGLDPWVFGQSAHRQIGSLDPRPMGQIGKSADRHMGRLDTRSLGELDTFFFLVAMAIHRHIGTHRQSSKKGVRWLKLQKASYKLAPVGVEWK